MLQRQLPCNVPQLSWLLRLMQLGVAARNSLRESRFVTPPHPARDLHGVSGAGEHVWNARLLGGADNNAAACTVLLAVCY